MLELARLILALLLHDYVQYAVTAVCLLTATYMYYCYSCYLNWEVHFARKRVTRRMENSPSNENPPEVSPWETNQTLVLNNAQKHPNNFGSCELLDHLLDKDVPKTNADLKSLSKARMERVPTFGYAEKSLNQAVAATMGGASEVANKIQNAINDIMKSSGTGSLSNKTSSKLHMDHVYVPLTHYIWALTFIGPQAMYLWVTGLTKLAIRQFLCKTGILRPIPHDPAEIVGRLCLEGTMAIHYYASTKDEKVAGFFFANFPIILPDGTAKVCDLFAVDIDLETKKMVKAKLDDRHLTAEEALILCWFNTIAANHVKLHSLANWGVNNEPDAWENDWFVAQSSLVTIMYNYFGYTVFGTFMQRWHKWGFLTMDCSSALTKCFNVGIEEGIWSHPDIRDLMKHSELVNFIVRVRTIFMSEFSKRKDTFPGIHGEALFVGTVMHSLDHTIMDKNLEDPMWLDVDHPEFGIMAEIGRIVKVGFVKDVPGLLFHKRFKGSNHPFYESVYAKAAKIDQFMADNMDTCIIK